MEIRTLVSPQTHEEEAKARQVIRRAFEEAAKEQEKIINKAKEIKK